MEENKIFTVPATVIALFESVAGMAMAAGREFRLEITDFSNDRSNFGPFGVNNTSNRSLALHVYGPEDPREEDDDGDDGGAGSSDEGAGGGDPDGE